MMLYACFASLIKYCNPLSSSSVTKRWEKGQRLQMRTKQSSCDSGPLILLPVLPREISSRAIKHSMDIVDEENFSLLLVTSPFPSHGGLNDVLGAGNKI